MLIAILLAAAIHWPTITEKKLDNGLTVVLVPLPNVPKVTAELTFLAGRGTGYREHPGMAQLAGRVLNEGTTTRTSKQLKEELRSIGGSMNVTVDDDGTTIAANALSEFSPKLPEDALAPKSSRLASSLSFFHSIPFHLFDR